MNEREALMRAVLGSPLDDMPKLVMAADSIEQANQALSDACVAYGRKLAGLPVLEKSPCPVT